MNSVNVASFMRAINQVHNGIRKRASWLAHKHIVRYLSIKCRWGPFLHQLDTLLLDKARSRV